MSVRGSCPAVVVAVLLAGGLFLAEGKSAEKKETAVCPISGEPISRTAAIDYKGGRLYFCCPHCISKFNEATAKYEAKANLQLVATGQAKQFACPLTGKKLNPATALSVAGTEVQFCCNGCKGRVSKADPAKQLEMVFGKTFDKGFKVEKEAEKLSKVRPIT